MKSNKAIARFNPFPGLRPFTAEESELFFGREKESEEVLNKLLKNRFVTVTGASGSGKSSLVLLRCDTEDQRSRTQGRRPPGE